MNFVWMMICPYLQFFAFFKSILIKSIYKTMFLKIYETKREIALSIKNLIPSSWNLSNLKVLLNAWGSYSLESNRLFWRCHPFTWRGRIWGLAVKTRIAGSG